MTKKNEDQDIEIELEEEGSTDSLKLKKIKEELKTAKKERQEYLDGWQRSRAEYANLKRESEDGKGRTTEIIKSRILEDFLPALDSFEMAFKNKLAWEKVDQNWRVGVEYIYNQIKSIMEGYGLEEIDDTGKEFDPNIHVAIETEETKEEKV